MKLLRSRILAAAAALIFAAGPLVAVAGEITDGQTPTNGKPYSGDLQGGWDGTSHRVIRSDSNGNLYVFDRSTDDLRVELNLRSNNGQNNPAANGWVSSVIDLRRMGPNKMLLIRASGNAQLYVGIIAGYSSVMDSTSSFNFRLGGCNPRTLATDVRGSLMFLGGTTTLAGGAADSTLATRAAWAIPLCDSVTRGNFSAPYAKLIILTQAGVTASNVYAHIVGGLR